MFSKKGLRILFYMAISLIAGFTIGISIKFLYEKSTFKPYHWSSPPIIANCYGDDFSELQMIRAIDYWTIREHQIAFYEHNPPDSICESNEMILGFIILRKAKPLELEPGTLANTRRMTSGISIKSAEIKYRKGTQNLYLINEHELGHALGYTHVNIEGHVMHPIYGKMGPKFWIP